jgi:hypothetical protein
MRNKAKQANEQRLAELKQRQEQLSARNKARKNTLARAMKLAGSGESYQQRRKTTSNGTRRA